MAEPLVILQSRQDDWLIGIEARKLIDLAQERYEIILQQPQKRPIILIAEPDPLYFLASFIAACTAHCSVFLGNPNWTKPEWAQVFQLVTPDLIWGITPSIPESSHCFVPRSPNWIMIPTGGSSGKIRFAIHTWETLLSSVMGFREYFQIEKINSYCVLPLYHVSGLMQVLRSLLTDGNLILSTYQSLPNHHPTDTSNYFLSLVPTQLQNIIHTSNLSRFQTVLLGGAPAWAELLETARQKRIRLAPTYGMTETASQVVTLKPDDFLQGRIGCGQVLPHAQVILSEPNGQVGRITIQSQSLALGYYPHLFPSTVFQTDDLGVFDPEGYLQIVGRSSHKIITGGENVFPIEVEAAIRASGLVKDVCVLGLSDVHWGEIIAAVYVPVHAGVTPLAIQESIQHTLSRYKHPKRWVSTSILPRNAQGKVSLEVVRKMLDLPPPTASDRSFDTESPPPHGQSANAHPPPNPQSSATP
jgi:o-succinylbenzoate---CoA ligase